MNIEQVREYTLSLLGVTEDQPFGDDIITFRLEGKIFVCLWIQSILLTFAPEKIFKINNDMKRLVFIMAALLAMSLSVSAQTSKKELETWVKGL